MTLPWNNHLTTRRFTQIPATPHKSDAEPQHKTRGAIAGHSVAAPAVTHVVAPAGALAQADGAVVLLGASEGPRSHHHPHLIQTVR